MTIEFSEKQFRTLLKAVFWAEWLKNNHKAEEEIDDEGADLIDLEQHVYSHAKQYGSGDLIAPPNEEGEYLPTSQLEDSAMEAILDYEDLVFWSELAERLAERDLGELPEDERSPLMDHVQIEDLAERYMSEFERNGLDNLRLVDED